MTGPYWWRLYFRTYWFTEQLEDRQRVMTVSAPCLWIAKIIASLRTDAPLTYHRYDRALLRWWLPLPANRMEHNLKLRWLFARLVLRRDVLRT